MNECLDGKMKIIWLNDVEGYGEWGIKDGIDVYWKLLK